MYQGKFDQKNKKTSVDVQELVAQRNSASAKKASSAPIKQEAPVRKETPAAKAAPVRTPAPVKKDAPVKNPAPAKKDAPAKKQPAPQVQAAPKRRGPRLGGVIFYTLYFLFIFLFFAGTYVGLQWLHGWLCDYEAAQPTTKCQEVFDQLFSDPDWSALYDAAGVEDTLYEGKEAFVSYMENKVGDSELTYLETSTGLSTDKMYIVKLGSEKVATFTLVGKTDHPTDIPDWQLGSIELFYERQESFLIELADGYTAYVNGVALDDSFTIQVATTKADSTPNFLPIGVSSPKTYVQQITGLMAVPTVTVTDASGQDVPVSYDAETRTFTAQTEANTMSDTEKELALNAIKTYAEYQIKEASANKVAKYFDSSSDAYSNIMATVLNWTKGNNGYMFSNDSVTGYARYSDTLFSVYATTELTINLTDGGTTVKSVNATLLFQLKNGSWKVIHMTNADVSEPVGKVRLTFMNEDTVLVSELYENDTNELIIPIPSADEGKVFAGWVRKDKNEDGSTTLTLVFTPDDSGLVTIPSGTTLEPMTLYAYFEDAGAVADTTAAPETTEGA